jgi:hypothetical protein
MKISDKIRNWCIDSEVLGEGNFDKLRELADRIDDEMVELPMDADGVPVHVSDTVWGYASGIERVVTGMNLTDKWTLSTDGGYIAKSTEVTHKRPDSFERIADELDVIVESADFADDEKLADLANRIRKLANHD